MSKKNLYCDCGQLATRKDSTGSSCEACHVAVGLAAEQLERAIVDQRRQARDNDEQTSAEYWREYYQLNKNKLRTYQREYQRRRKTGTVNPFNVYNGAVS